MPANLKTCEKCECFYPSSSSNGPACLLKLETMEFDLPGIRWKKGKKGKMCWVKTTEEEYRAHEEKANSEFFIQHQKFKIPENCLHPNKHK